jgi:hypothetical protein
MTIVSEYISHRSLYQFRRTARNRARLDGTQRTLIAMGVAHAMMYLHSLKIVHGNLKSGTILLDDNLLPVLCNYGLDDKQSYSPRWGAPELLAGEEYGREVDIYSFGMVLYELVTDQVPWEGETPERITKRVLWHDARPLLPRTCAGGIRHLIEMCWARDPAHRPAFFDIYETVAAHDAEFNRTDQRIVDAFARKLAKVGVTHSRHSLLRRGTSTNSRAATATETYEILSSTVTSHEPDPFVDLQAIADPRNRSYAAEMKRAARSLPECQSREFMAVVARLFQDARSQTPEMLRLLEALQVLLQRPCHAEVFGELGLHKALPLNGKEPVFNAALDVLLVLFDANPTLFARGFEDQMRKIIRAAPQKAIVLLSAFARACPDLADGWGMLDLLLEERRFFFKASCGVELVSILNWLNRHSPEFRKTRSDDGIDVFRAGLPSSDPHLIGLCYAGLADLSEPDQDRRLDYGVIAAHLADKTLSPNCLDLLVRVRELPVLPSLVHALLNCAEHHVEAVLCLIRIAAVEEGAAILLARPVWITHAIPTVFDTLRLYLVVMAHVNSRQVLSRLKQTDVFLIRLCKERDADLFSCMAAIIKKLDLDEEIVDRMSKSGVLKEIFKTALEFDDGVSAKAALAILRRLAKIGFYRECLMMATKLRDLIAVDSELSWPAILVVVQLSKYAIWAKKFQDLRVDRLFKRLLNDPDQRQIAEDFLATLAASNLY